MKQLLIPILVVLTTGFVTGQKLPSLESIFLTSRKAPDQIAKSSGASFTPTKTTVTPFFCRLENKWEKRSGHGVRFRLGDTYTVDKFEGKVNPVSTGR